MEEVDEGGEWKGVRVVWRKVGETDLDFSLRGGGTCRGGSRLRGATTLGAAEIMLCAALFSAAAFSAAFASFFAFLCAVLVAGREGRSPPVQGSRGVNGLDVEVVAGMVGEGPDSRVRPKVVHPCCSGGKSWSSEEASIPS